MSTLTWVTDPAGPAQTSPGVGGPHKEVPGKTEGITWHAVTLDPEAFGAMKTLLTGTVGLTPAMEMEGVTVFMMPNGTILETIASGRERRRDGRRRPGLGGLNA